jgi:hypothetical protein
MALTKAQVEELVYRKKSVTDNVTVTPPTISEKEEIRDKVTNLLKLILNKHT